MEDKWMKFFIPSLSRPEIDTDKALCTVYKENPKEGKPSLEYILQEYIKDKRGNFTDKQKIRALDI